MVHIVQLTMKGVQEPHISSDDGLNDHIFHHDLSVSMWKRASLRSQAESLYRPYIGQLSAFHGAIYCTLPFTYSYKPENNYSCVITAFSPITQSRVLICVSTRSFFNFPLYLFSFLYPKSNSIFIPPVPNSFCLPALLFLLPIPPNDMRGVGWVRSPLAPGTIGGRGGRGQRPRCNCPFV